MPSPTLNRQPIFTSTPILATSQFDPAIPTSFKDPGMDTGTSIFTDTSTYGSLITKVTVTATGKLGDNVTNKIIYLGIQDVVNSVVTLYQSKVMTGKTGLTSTDQVPYVVFEFGGGLVMSATSGYKLILAASTNNATTGEVGDQVSVVVEGGTYDYLG